MTARILSGLTVLLALINPSAAQEPTRGRWFVEGFSGKSLVPFLGSEDLRTAHGFGIGFVRRTPWWLHHGRSPSDMWSQIYYHTSTSPGASQQPPNRANAIGILTTVRYWAPSKGNVRAYLEVGGGIQLANRTTVDNTSRLNGTPALGVGVSFRGGSSDVLIGVRLLHISNAGFRGTNQGQNQLTLTVGVRF